MEDWYTPAVLQAPSKIKSPDDARKYVVKLLVSEGDYETPVLELARTQRCSGLAAVQMGNSYEFREVRSQVLVRKGPKIKQLQVAGYNYIV